MQPRRKPVATPETDLNTPEAVERFRKAAAEFGRKATRSRASALKVLVEIGLSDNGGKLTRKNRS